MIKRKLLHKRRRKRLNRKHDNSPSKIRKKREPFRTINGISIPDLKHEIIKMQSELAVVLRNKQIERVIQQIRKMLRSNLTQQLAVYRTISSSGAKSIGIGDKEKPITQRQYADLRLKLWKIIKNPRKYIASPLRRVWIPKPNSDEFRPLSVPSYIDRALQHLYLLILDVIAEETADTNSFGFRSFRSPGWAAKALTLQIWSRKSYGPPRYAVELDIKKCFDSISHNYIIELVSNFRLGENTFEIINSHIISQWLTCGYIDILGVKTPKNQLIPTEKGIPQGGPISPIIANMTLDGLENTLKDQYQEVIAETIEMHNITEYDQVVWKYENKEVLYTTGINIENSSIINKALRTLGLDPPKSMARQFYKGAWIHNRDSWSYRIMNDDAILYNKREKINNSYISMVRYADDITLLANNMEKINKSINKIKEFLAIRGLEVNDHKTHIKDMYAGEKATFVGYEFSITRINGKWKVYNYPPKEKILNVKKKVHETFLKYKYKPYTAFYVNNSILRGWTNFYRTANAKNAFNTLNEWLFKRTYKYLTTYLKNNPKYKIKSQRYNKKLLGYDLWKTFVYKWHPKYKSKWFCIPQQLNPNIRWSKFDASPYLLLNPKFIEVSTPSIITGLSAYIPSERYELNEKAMYWKPDFIRKLLIKLKGECKSCGVKLLDNYEEYDIHHVQPISKGGRKNLTNLTLLCKDCHIQVTTAVKSKNIEQIALYENAKILKNVSDLIILESDSTPDTKMES